MRWKSLSLLSLPYSVYKTLSGANHEPQGEVFLFSLVINSWIDVIHPSPLHTAHPE